MGGFLSFWSILDINQHRVVISFFEAWVCAGRQRHGSFAEFELQ